MIITVVLLHNDSLFHTTLEMGQEISFGSHKKDEVQVPDFAPGQLTVKWKPNGVSVKAVKAYDLDAESVPLDTLLVIDEETKTVLFLSSLTSHAPQTITLPYNCRLRFGRTEENDVTINLPFVSSSHFVLKNECGNVRVEDTDSLNGIYVNGKHVSIARLKSGDVLSIMSVQIQLTSGELHFYNVGDALSYHPTGEDDDESAQIERKGSRLLYHRSPRIQSRLPSEDILLAAPPSKGQPFTPGRGMFGTMASSGAMFAASLLTSAASPALLAARAASMISPVTSLASSKSSDKRGKKNAERYEQLRKEKYGAYIDDQKARIASVARVQRDILNAENPNPEDSVDCVFGLRRNLWERMPSDRDFLDVRIGMGYEDLCVSVKSRAEQNGFQMEDDEIRELSAQIVEETRIVDNVPTRLKLLRQNTVGIVGDRSKVLSLVRNLIISLTVSHSSEDVRLVGIFDESEKSFWEAIRWLPHIWDDQKQFRFLAFGKEEAHKLCEILNDLLKKRKEALPDGNSREESFPSPHYIFLLGSKELTEKEEIMGNLLTNRPEMGVTTLFLFDDIRKLPNDCRYMVDLSDVPCAYPRNEANRPIYFTPDPPLDSESFDGFARRMSAIEPVGLAKAAGLPSGISFLEGYGVKKVEELNVTERWKASKPYRTLAAPIGVMAGGKTFSLNIHEKGHGPHGLVAGTTGSGKSELLQTWILSMALHYHPHDVAFVIIDYKGGGMANLFFPSPDQKDPDGALRMRLPHVVGKITNISANIERALISLQSEIKRRLALFDRYGVSHIDDYQKMVRAGKISDPMPHLILVSDEFAELKKEEPEFMAGLVSASRVGRSIGIHLVLATQKPGGVVDDQIESNSRFRLCLKVQDVNDSREMIKRPDAARLTQAGRSYIRVGEDEYFDLFQSYWSGAPYRGEREKEKETENPVRLVEFSGRRVKTVEEKKKNDSGISELTAVVRYICSATKEEGIVPLPGPWLPELPEKLTLKELGVPGGFDGEKWRESPPWLNVPIGKFDIPKAQAQGVQWLNFAADGHYGIYGAPGTGKTSLLKEIVLALGLYYTPSDVNLYILDCGGWGMSVFSGMPHVGSIALDQEEEKFLKFEKLIQEEFDRRKKIFLSNTVSSLSAYRESVAEDIPALILVVDNIVSLFDLYPDLENLFVTIAREGSTYGIYLLYTANSTTGVRYKVLQNIRGAIAFELTDKGDYAALVGRPESGLPKTVGRAFFKNNPPTEFQAALYSDGENDREKTQKLKALLSDMNAAWKGPRPLPIPVMPEKVTADMLATAYSAREILPVGISFENTRPAAVDLSERYSLLISGPIKSGKSRLLLLLSSLIAGKFPDTSLYVFDGEEGALSSLKDRAFRYASVKDGASSGAMLADLMNCLNDRMRDFEAEMLKSGDAFDKKAFASRLPLICIVIDDIREFVDAVPVADQDLMDRICRLAQGLGVVILAAGRMSDIQKYNEIEAITHAIVAQKNGLATGGTPAQLSFFANDLKYTEREQEAGEGNGYLFINGKCVKIKLPQ